MEINDAIIPGSRSWPVETAPSNRRVLIYGEMPEGTPEMAIGWKDRSDGRWYFAPQGGLVPFNVHRWRDVPGAEEAEVDLAARAAGIERDRDVERQAFAELVEAGTKLCSRIQADMLRRNDPNTILEFGEFFRVLTGRRPLSLEELRERSGRGSSL